MQSFKQYLMEEYQVYANALEIYFNFSHSLKRSPVEKTLVTHLRNTLSFGKRIQYVGVEDNTASMRIPAIKPNEYADRANLDAYFAEATAVAEKYVKQKISSDIVLNKNHSRYGLHFDRIPSEIVDCDNIVLFPLSDISLKGSAKMFAKIEELVIQKPERIKSSVLGLLKLKNIRIIIAGNAEWKDIFMKHYTTDKNIVACQEEFYKNDLDQYAEL